MHPPAPSCRKVTRLAMDCACGLGNLGSKWPMPPSGSLPYPACWECSCDGRHSMRRMNDM
eukprot:8777448-Alexandrium_andersonii.AAC.1